MRCFPPSRTWMALITLQFPTTALAYDLHPLTPYAEQQAAADAVFVGETLQVDFVYTYQYAMATHIKTKVTQAFKGVSVGDVVTVVFPGGVSGGVYHDQGFPLPDPGDEFLLYSELHSGGRHLTLYGPQSVILNHKQKATTTQGRSIVDLSCTGKTMVAVDPHQLSYERVSDVALESDVASPPRYTRPESESMVFEADPASVGLPWADAVSVLGQCASISPASPGPQVGGAP